MKLDKKERRFWKYKMNVRPEQYPRHLERLNLRDSGLTNDELGYLLKQVISIDQLDLDECPIDDQGILHLKQLSGLKELRLKGVQITDASIAVLKEFRDLELLHLGGTLVTASAILELTGLQSLKKLLVSSDSQQDEIYDRFLEAKPDCELVVDHQVWKRT